MLDPNIIQLINALLKNSISPAEKETLAKWVEESEGEQLDKVLESSWHTFEPQEHLDQVKAKEMFQSILLATKTAKRNSDPKVVSLKSPTRRIWKAVAVAASVIGIAGIIAYFSWNLSKVKEPVVVAAAQDVKPPQINKATITLAGGQVIILDSTANGTVAKQNNVAIVKTGNGQIAYQSSGSNSGTVPVTYNTLNNPRGSKPVSLTLADGSKVWLNTESSLTYPTQFTGTERKVKITGEAYFEVAHNAAMPFKVDNGNTEVTVLGTHFNVNTYNDEAAMKVTLLEGSVKVTLTQATGNREAILKPGEQEIVTTAGAENQLRTLTSVDLDQVMAWKNGLFNFGEGEDIKSVMKQIARWYDIQVKYEGPVKGHLWGTISRNVNVSEVLKLLAMTGSVKFTIDGKTVTVRQ